MTDHPAAARGPHQGRSTEERSRVQQIFASYSDCEYLSGAAVKDDDGTVLQTAAWLGEGRFDDFLDELSHALVAAGVGRDALMRVFLRHALRVLNDDPDSMDAGTEDNRNALRLIDVILEGRHRDESLREKVARVARGLPVPLGPTGRRGGGGG